MQWFYVANGKQGGPITDAELAELVRTGQLKPTDFVWNESMGETWARAEAVAGLFASPCPPPLTAGLQADVSAVSGRISFGDPAKRAWDRMHAMLFRPVNLGKWFALGFSAWLATLGEQGGGGGGFNAGSAKWQEKMQEYAGDPARLLEEARQFMQAHLLLIVSLVGLATLVSVALGLVFLWIRSRGKFMFLDNVVNDRTEIAGPWRTFRQHGNSLCLWRFIYGLICVAVAGLLVGAAAVSFILPLLHGASPAVLAVPIALNVGAWIVLAVVAGYISRYLEDFVIPIMYNDNLRATEAWTRFLVLFGEYRGRFILYGLYYMLLSMLAGACVVMLVLCTFCLAGCLMMFPYVGTVVLLPALVFFRLFSLEFLAQFGPEFRMRMQVDADSLAPPQN